MSILTVAETPKINIIDRFTFTSAKELALHDQKEPF
jgi:hypothetical protein